MPKLTNQIGYDSGTQTDISLINKRNSVNTEPCMRCATTEVVTLRLKCWYTEKT